MTVTNNFKRYIKYSSPGINKTENQDNYLILETEAFALFAVFDGVGSAQNSKVGTEIAKTFISQHFSKFIRETKVSLNALMFECNNYLIEQNIPEIYTTYCTALLHKDHNDLFFSSLGDSRIYLVSDQYLEQITTDDKSLLAKNVLTKCLGMNDLSLKDFTQGNIDLGVDSILLCTDGFYNLLETDKKKFFETLNKKNLQSIYSGLVSLISNKNVDDSTFIMISQDV
ncbi:protein phosphatase 2C domain-containing protein [Dyadobacter sp. 676]|uniref:Protein phosphatase 2C domain-containing protein n=1 Tax=Dyadobacter sp. 676 TaxID=3088362 RepID=A0AAU8FJZ5_9BACT